MSFLDLFSNLLSYDPNTIAVEQRDQVASILRARSEYLRATAEVTAFRARSWSGEVGLADLAELKAADLAKLRQDYMKQAGDLLRNPVDVESLLELLPMVLGGVLQSFKIPAPVLMEVLGADLDQLKIVVEKVKELFEEM